MTTPEQPHRFGERKKPAKSAGREKGKVIPKHRRSRALTLARSCLDLSARKAVLVRPASSQACAGCLDLPALGGYPLFVGLPNETGPKRDGGEDDRLIGVQCRPMTANHLSLPSENKGFV